MLITNKLARPPIRRPRKSSPQTSYTAGQLAKRYGFYTPPTTQTQWVAVISLGGGFSQTDINAYCAQYSLPVPPVRFISVQGATNSYTGDPNSADGENVLDIQNIIGATGGKVGILFYCAPNSDSGFAGAINQVAIENLACACTISWGSNEPSWSASGISAMNAAIQACLAKSIPVFAASGDDGSSDGGNGNNVDFPASSPYVIGCGGTSLTSSGETAWNYGGGGISANFPRLAIQAGLPVSLGQGRLVPDMALDADPNSGYPVVINGTWDTFGGTSAVGPMMAAGIALVVSNTGKRVDPNKLFSAIYSGSMSDITTGANTSISGGIATKFTAGKGFDLCTGNGVPNAAFWAALASVPTSPPPPPPPPTVPPPPTIPPPPTVPPPVMTWPPEAAVQAIVDAGFAELIAAFARVPIFGRQLVAALMQEQAKIDAALKKLYASQPHLFADYTANPAAFNWQPILLGLLPVLLQILQGFAPKP